MTKIGYVRCSSADQNPARQEALLKKAGCKKVFSYMLSGKDRNRPGLQAMLDYVREGDVLYVESISRLARSTRDLLQILDELQAREVQFISAKENIDTSTPQGKFMLTVFAALSELEREQIRQRQAEGIAIAKQQGKYQGRQPIQYDKYLFEQLYKQWEDGDITQKYMCKKLKMSPATLTRRIREYRNSHNH
jgi:DNA invertase Pin-like site-specific DNA recombinase